MSASRTYYQYDLNAESLKIPRGNPYVLTCTYKDSSGTAISLATLTAGKFTVVSRLTGLRVIQKTYGSGIAKVGDGTAGQFTVTLSASDTDLAFGDYDYDLEITYATTVTVTLAVGTFRLWETYSDYSAT